MNAQFVKDFLGISQYIHKVGNGRTLVTGNITDAGLQQTLGDGQNALAAEFFTSTDTELLDFFLE